MIGTTVVKTQDARGQGSLLADAVAGALAGQVSGLVMAAVVMAVFTFFLGKGPLFPVQVIGSFAWGEAALDGFHLPAFLTGLVLHQAGPSLFWGALFGVASRGLRGGELAAAAVVTGLLSQVVDAHLVLPPLMKALHGKDLWAANVPLFWSWAAHLVFGLGLLVIVKLRR